VSVINAENANALHVRKHRDVKVSFAPDAENVRIVKHVYVTTAAKTIALARNVLIVRIAACARTVHV